MCWVVNLLVDDVATKHAPNLAIIELCNPPFVTVAKWQGAIWQGLANRRVLWSVLLRHVGD